MNPVTLVILIIAVALIFDFINGFHDAANSIATVVGPGFGPNDRRLLGGFFNSSPAFALHRRAKTIGKGVAIRVVD